MHLNKEALLELVDQFVSSDDIWGIYCDELNEYEKKEKNLIWQQISLYWSTGEYPFLVNAMSLIQEFSIEDEGIKAEIKECVSNWNESKDKDKKDTDLKEDNILTKEKVKERVFEMLKDSMKDGEIVDKKIDSILMSGAIDVSSHDDNYFLPKIVLASILKELAYQFSPISPEGKDILNNLKHF